MAIRNLNTSNRAFPLEYRVGKIGDPHPYPDLQKVSFQRPGRKDLLGTADTSFIIERAYRYGLNIDPAKVKPISLDFCSEAFQGNLSMVFDLPALLNVKGSALLKAGVVSPFKGKPGLAFMCAAADLALNTGAMNASESMRMYVFNGTRVASTLATLQDRLPKEIMTSLGHMSLFDWSHILLIFAHVEIARGLGRSNELKGDANMLKLTDVAEISNFSYLNIALSALGLSEELGYRNFILPVASLRPFFPELINWMDRTGFSVNKLYSLMKGETPEQCFRIFERLRNTPMEKLMPPASHSTKDHSGRMPINPRTSIENYHDTPKGKWLRKAGKFSDPFKAIRWILENKPEDETLPLVSLMRAMSRINKSVAQNFGDWKNYGAACAFLMKNDDARRELSNTAADLRRSKTPVTVHNLLSRIDRDKFTKTRGDFGSISASYLYMAVRLYIALEKFFR